MEDNIINFVELEKELQATVEADQRYWKENDAKLRAVNQRVSSYEEFKDLVRGAHLRPLEKSDKQGYQQRVKNSIWNSLAVKKKSLLSTSATNMQSTSAQNEGASPFTIQDLQKLPATSSEFSRLWHQLDVCDRLVLLQRMGPSTLGHLFRTEIPAGLLGEILHTLLAFTPTMADIVLVVGILEAMTEAKRFGLSLQFLSSLERSTCRQLLEKILMCLQDWQQDLAEEGITEYTIQELRRKYQLS